MTFTSGTLALPAPETSLPVVVPGDAAILIDGEHYVTSGEPGSWRTLAPGETVTDDLRAAMRTVGSLTIDELRIHFTIGACWVFALFAKHHFGHHTYNIDGHALSSPDGTIFLDINGWQTADQIDTAWPGLISPPFPDEIVPDEWSADPWALEPFKPGAPWDHLASLITSTYTMPA